MSSQSVLATDESHKALHVAAPRKRRHLSWVFWMVSFTVFLFVVAISSLIYMATAYVMGYEVNATTWQVRHFSFFRDPFTETQLSLIKHSTSTQHVLEPAIATHIVGGPIRPTTARWDLMHINRGARSSAGEAAILFTYLDTRDQSFNKTWDEWTLANPQSAPLLWSAVRDVVHLPRYDRLPEVFDAVRVHSDPGNLKMALDQIMADIALDEAKSQADAGDKRAAKRAAIMGLSYDESPELTVFVDDRPAEAETQQATQEDPR